MSQHFKKKRINPRIKWPYTVHKRFADVLYVLSVGEYVCVLGLWVTTLQKVVLALR